MRNYLIYKELRRAGDMLAGGLRMAKMISLTQIAAGVT